MYPNPPQMPQAPAPQPYPQQYQTPQAPVQQYPPQQPYPPQYQAAPAPAQPLANGTLDGFFSQPSTGGGKALTFEAVGTTYVGIVSRPIGDGDIQQQTDTQNRPAFFRDGRPKYVMKVPLQMQPTPAYPDGLAQWFVKGQARDELVRAMSQAGAPEGPPEAGAVIQITLTGTRPSGPGMNPAKLFQVVYQRPNGGQPVAPQTPAQVSAPPAPVQAPAPVYAPAPVAQPAPVPVAAAPAPAPMPAPAAAAPALSDDQKALLAKLTGAQPTG